MACIYIIHSNNLEKQDYLISIMLMFKAKQLFVLGLFPIIFIQISQIQRIQNEWIEWVIENTFSPHHDHLQKKLSYSHINRLESPFHLLSWKHSNGLSAFESIFYHFHDSRIFHKIVFF